MISLIKKALGRKSHGAVVLMYHRIATSDSDPWDLCVSPVHFEEHLQALKENFHVVPMFRLAQRLSQREKLKDLVSLTFDDGYLDNYTHAKPILEKHNVPGAFFFTTLFQSPFKKFWWDELEQLILHTPVLPDTVNLTLGKKTISLILGQAKILTDQIMEENRVWRYGHPLVNARIKLYVELWGELKAMGIAERNEGLQQIKNWAGTSLVSTAPLMNASQIRELTDSGLFEAGAHSVNHPALGTLSSSDQKAEIEISKEELENIVANPITGFAYPYGHYNEKTPVLTKRAGFRYALTTAEHKVTLQDSVFEIPRFQVKDIAADELVKNIRLWQTR